jgi:hypothetical protein
MTCSKREEKSQKTSLNHPAQWYHHPQLHRPVATSMTCAVTLNSIPGNCPLLSSPSRFIENGVNQKTWYITNHAMRLWRKTTANCIDPIPSTFFKSRAKFGATRNNGPWDWHEIWWPPLFKPLPFSWEGRPGSVGPWASACTVVPQYRFCDIEIDFLFLYSVSYLVFCLCAGLLKAFPEWFMQPSGFSFVSLFKGMEWTKVRDSSLIFPPCWVLSQ